MSTLKPKGTVSTPKLGAVKLYSKVIFGSSGAIFSQTDAASSGFTVALLGTGEYSLTFVDNWDAMLFIQGILYNAGTAKGETIELHDKLTSKVAIINIVSDGGAAEEPASGHELWLEVTMSNTGVGP